MDFHELEAFVALAKTLHFARAAAAIHTSPSGLSRLLGRLEDELGAKLAERDTRRVQLTEAGRDFLDFAEDSLRRREELRLGLGSRDGSLRGFLRVYASVTACYSVLPPFAEALVAAYPELSLSVETGDPADAELAASSGRVDLAVAAIPDGGFAGLDAFAVRRSPLVFVGARSGPWGRLDLARSEDPIVASETEVSGRAATLDRTRAAIGNTAERERKLAATLASTPLILPATGLARERFDRWSREHGFRPRIAAETGGNEPLLAFARLGLGLALVPRIVVESGPFADGLAIYDGGPAFGDYDIGFVLKPPRPRSDSGRLVYQALADLLEQAYPDGVWR
ncbi:MAG: LysR substrate-binding domain-containing protein [Clostridia bacterium]|jgi:LysR family positive regulator for ilvC